MPDIEQQIPSDQPILELSEFQRLNPYSEISIEDHKYVISKPWDDETLDLVVDPNNTDLKAVLNSVLLPPKFYAIWHTDTKTFEIIWGPVNNGSPFVDRKFEFVFDGSVYDCGFSDASDQLTAIREAYRPVASDQEFRSPHRLLKRTQGFFNQVDKRDPEAAADLLSRYRIQSFFVHDIEYDEDYLIRFVKAFNVFTQYFDRRLPMIEIDYPDSPNQKIVFDPTPAGDFPTRIVAHDVDEAMYPIWLESIKSPDPIQQFLHSFQVIEYASFYYLREETDDAVRRVISSPSIHQDLRIAVERIQDILAEDKTEPAQKLQKVVAKYVDPANVWSTIMPVREHFEKKHVFAGGYVQDPIIDPNTTEDIFEKIWRTPLIPDSLRKMRNALSHARERREALVISPAKENLPMIRVWSELAKAVALQIMIARQS
jgi:hypothetical protein